MKYSCCREVAEILAVMRKAEWQERQRWEAARLARAEAPDQARGKKPGQKAQHHAPPQLAVSSAKSGARRHAQLARRVRSRDALARYGWSPYMHNPKLPGRLHRVRAASLVLWGAQDRMVSESCVRLFAESLPNSRLVTVAKAAHLPHLEQSDIVLGHLSSLLGDNGASQSTRAREPV